MTPHSFTAFCNVCGAYGTVTVSGLTSGSWEHVAITQFDPLLPPGPGPMWQYASGYACSQSHFNEWLNGNHDYWTKNRVESGADDSD